MCVTLCPEVTVLVVVAVQLEGVLAAQGHSSCGVQSCLMAILSECSSVVGTYTITCSHFLSSTARLAAGIGDAPPSRGMRASPPHSPTFCSSEGVAAVVVVVMVVVVRGRPAVVRTGAADHGGQLSLCLKEMVSLRA
ncbi:hypothetical protein E2C01_019239 [Portunus trituberculatus]|uniref:Secreted protein n=1 Tax=Portunus trituberculatus TaxID=210409 RepID=A0A5B7DYM8_PORTR|nr:hypothetical protein [Portunus trituberculatus]